MSGGLRKRESVESVFVSPTFTTAVEAEKESRPDEAADLVVSAVMRLVAPCDHGKPFNAHLVQQLRGRVTNLEIREQRVTASPVREWALEFLGSCLEVVQVRNDLEIPESNGEAGLADSRALERKITRYAKNAETQALKEKGRVSEASIFIARVSELIRRSTVEIDESVLVKILQSLGGLSLNQERGEQIVVSDFLRGLLQEINLETLKEGTVRQMLHLTARLEGDGVPREFWEYVVTQMGAGSLNRFPEEVAANLYQLRRKSSEEVPEALFTVFGEVLGPRLVDLTIQQIADSLDGLYDFRSIKSAQTLSCDLFREFEARVDILRSHQMQGLHAKRMLQMYRYYRLDPPEKLRKALMKRGETKAEMVYKRHLGSLRDESQIKTDWNIDGFRCAFYAEFVREVAFIHPETGERMRKSQEIKLNIETPESRQTSDDIDLRRRDAYLREQGIEVCRIIPEGRLDYQIQVVLAEKMGLRLRRDEAHRGRKRPKKRFYRRCRSRKES